MKVSQLIRKLQEDMEINGDLEVFFIVKSGFSASSSIKKIEKGTLGDLLIWL